MATCVCPFPMTDCPRCAFACPACVEMRSPAPMPAYVAAPTTVPVPEVARDTHPRPGDVYHNDGIGEVTLTGRNKRNDDWTTNNPAVELMDSGFASGHHKLVKAGPDPGLDRDVLRAERDQARADLATERARSAGLTRALEVAREALREIRDRGTMEDEDTRIASRALAATDAVTGGGAGATCDPVSDHAKIALAGYEMGHAAALRGTPGAGEVPPCVHCGLADTDDIHRDDGENDHNSDGGTWHDFTPATPVAQRRPAGCRVRLNAAFLCGDMAGEQSVLCVYCQDEADRRGEP